MQVSFPENRKSRLSDVDRRLYVRVVRSVARRVFENSGDHGILAARRNRVMFFHQLRDETMAFVTVRHIEVVDETPMIAGTRFKVENIVAMVVWGDATIDWVVENFDLTRSQVHAALAYYYDNQALIDHALRENEELAREVGTPLADVIARLRAGQEDTA